MMNAKSEAIEELLKAVNKSVGYLDFDVTNEAKATRDGDTDYLDYLLSVQSKKLIYISHLLTCFTKYLGKCIVANDYNKISEMLDPNCNEAQVFYVHPDSAKVLCTITVSRNTQDWSMADIRIRSV